MQKLSEALSNWFDSLGSAEHLPASEGDFMGEDGRLHCGVCGEPKELLLPLNKRWVATACRCRKEEYARIEDEARRTEEQRVLLELASSSLIDEKFRESTFANFDCRDSQDYRVLTICRNYAERFEEMYQMNTGLLLYGSPGTGKTFAASCVANALMERGIPVLATSIVRLCADTYADELNETLRRMNAARLLVLDDFGAERATEYKAEQVFTVIDARYASKKPMIITTNLTDFKSETDIRRLRVYDRIFEVCVPVQMNGESRRKTEGRGRLKTIRAILEQ